MSAALGLYRLQQVDSQIDQIQSRLKANQQVLDNDDELRAANSFFSAAQEKDKQAAHLVKQSELEVEKQRIKIQQAEASLYGGLVKNPKELQDLQKDIASLKRHLETLEERQLEAMEVAESAEKDLQAANLALETLISSRGDQFGHLAKENEKLNKDLETLLSERSAVMKDISASMITVYDQLRRQRRGIAVATINDDSCAACGTTLNAALQQNARSASQLFNCPTCGRILYAN
jgi:predicted  nucleic acid-binding Zn-ribbon protein